MEFKPTIPRGPISSMYTSPGPIYGLPPLFGYDNHDFRSNYARAPTCPMGKRYHIDDKTIGPGPKYSFQNAAVYRTGKETAISALMLGRPTQNSRHSNPGPSSYNIEPSNAHRYPTEPKFTLGQRLETHTHFKTPAPNSYYLPPLLCNTVESTKAKAPAFTIASSPRDLFNSKNKQWQVAKARPAAYTFGMKHSPYIATPFPNEN
ncbi:outer dense fiber protein 3-B-like [Argonauta hians]